MEKEWVFRFSADRIRLEANVTVHRKQPDTGRVTEHFKQTKQDRTGFSLDTALNFFVNEKTSNY